MRDHRLKRDSKHYRLHSGVRRTPLTGRCPSNECSLPRACPWSNDALRPATSLDLNADELQLPPGPTRLQLRALVTATPPPPTNDSNTSPPPVGDRLVTSVEVFNNNNGRTVVFIGNGFVLVNQLTRDFGSRHRSFRLHHGTRNASPVARAAGTTKRVKCCRRLDRLTTLSSALGSKLNFGGHP